ncbi:hypothetical protein R9X47_27100 [Wukongibacter baidiensis]|uniref:hypothetical protein n=1 Tax=Wukongibacter baidiensis TaxID=1723361 RepID=UPI003D7F3B32
MEKRPFKRFNKYKKWKDITNIKATECILALIFTMLFLALTYFLDLYNGFQYYEEALKNITLYIASALIGMIGIILAGIALMLGLINKDIKRAMEKANGKGVIEGILVSFEFLAFIVAVEIALFFSLYILIYSPKELIPYFLFLPLLALVSYAFFFTIFYTVSLIGNCIRFFTISNMYSKIVHEEKNLHTKINEIRIDFILHSILENVTRDEFMDALLEFVDASNVEDKDDIKKYLMKYYSNN